MKKIKAKVALILTVIILANPLTVSANGTLGPGGPAWELKESDTLVIGGGPLSLGFSTVSPWATYSNYIRNIVFKSPINASGLMQGLFSGLDNLENIEGLYNLNTTGVLLMNSLFEGASSLTSLDLSNFSTENVIMASNMLAGTYNLSSLVLGDNFILPADANLPSRYWIEVNTGEVLHSSELTTGTWTWYVPSTSPSQIRVLTINPHNNASHHFARFFEQWVNGTGGTNQNLARNRNLNPLNEDGLPIIIFEQVTTYELTRPANNRNFVDIETLLRDEAGNYRFDIIAIGSWDYGGILRPGNEPHIIAAISEFMDSGGAVVFGHDTLTDRHRTSHGRGTTAQSVFGNAAGTLRDGEFYLNRLNRLYGLNYLFAPLAHRAGVIPSQRVDRFAHHSNTVARKFAIITEQGPLTSYPFPFEVGQVIPISMTHNNGGLTTGTVWAQFADRHNGNFRLNPYRNMAGGNTVINFPGRYITSDEWGNRHRNMPYAQNAFQPAGVYQSNAFVSTFENTAHIQSWRAVQYLTLEERMLFVNTLFYLYSRTN